jgi:hypothetical protein
MDEGGDTMSEQKPGKKFNLNPHPIIGELVEDPAAPPQVMQITGYLGKTPRAGYVRIYESLTLDEYTDVPEAAILHVEEVPETDLEYGGTRLFVNANAQVIREGRPGMQAESGYLEGAITAAHLSQADQAESGDWPGAESGDPPSPYAAEDPAVRTRFGWTCAGCRTRWGWTCAGCRTRFGWTCAGCRTRFGWTCAGCRTVGVHCTRPGSEPPSGPEGGPGGEPPAGPGGGATPAPPIGAAVATYGPYCGPRTYGAYCGPRTYGAYCGPRTYGAYCGPRTYGAYCGPRTHWPYCH